MADRYKNGWELSCDINNELLRQGINIVETDQLIAVINTDFQICSTYPEKIVVPAVLSQNDLISCAHHRSK
jgi:hypothetical protein